MHTCHIITRRNGGGGDEYVDQSEYCDMTLVQGDHFPDNVKFPDDSLTFPRRFVALLCGTRYVKCYSYHARTVLLSVVGVGMQQYNIYSLIFSKIPDISLTAVKFLTFPGFPYKWLPCLSPVNNCVWTLFCATRP